jgi:hypothetical protein
MGDDEASLQFDGLLLVRREGEVVLDHPERACGGHVAAVGAGADVDRQGLE